jgi:hypothetical protein
MAETPTNLLVDLRAASRLAIDATRALTDVVEAMHHAVSPIETRTGVPRTSGLTGFVYRSVRGVAGVAGGGIDLALGRLAPLLPARRRRPAEEAVIAALNGVIGDRLHDSGNTLAIPMRFRVGGRPLPLETEALRATLPGATSRIVVLVHGLCMNDLQWSRDGHDHGAALARDLGMTPVCLHYNTGRHVSSNGAAFAELMEALLAAWPVPVDDIAIVAHSMGGLVARSAHHAAERRGMAWTQRLSRIVFLGTPHHGAPLERGGNALDLVLSLSRFTTPIARIGHLRSAGITDLRHGSVLDADWRGRDRFERGNRRRPLALPARVRCYAVAATTATQDRARLPGDGLVPVDSALGRHADRRFDLALPPAQQWVAHATNHLQLQTDPRVYAQLKAWLAG